MEQRVNWGIIAAGGIAKRRTLPAMGQVKNAQVIAVMDTNEAAVRQIAKEYAIPYTYTDMQELLENPQVEAVYVASPVCFHKEQAFAVLDAGKHLLLEKPLGMNAEEAREIQNYARSVDCKSGVAMVMKHHPGHRAIKALIAKGELGDIVNCRAQLSCWFPDMEGNWRQKKETAGGGALMDMGIHCIDLLCDLIHDQVEWVFGDIGTKTFAYEVEDSADCILHMKKGAACYVDAHFNVPDESVKSMLEIYGTKGSVLAQGTIGQEGKGDIYVNYGPSQKAYDSQQVRDADGLGVRLEYDWENIYGCQIQAFSQAILEDGPVMTSMEQACETLRITDALYASAREKKAVFLLQSPM